MDMGIDINKLTEEQLSFVNSYKRINERLETLQRQMTIIQHEAKGLIEELEELRNKENKKLNNGKK
jgi:uncharacterized protein YoxC